MVEFKLPTFYTFVVHSFFSLGLGRLLTEVNQFESQGPHDPNCPGGHNMVCVEFLLLFVHVQCADKPLGSFATVGMFSAVSNLGAGGTQDVTLSDTSQGVLYGLFALTGLISGGINNCKLPMRSTFLVCLFNEEFV